MEGTTLLENACAVSCLVMITPKVVMVYANRAPPPANAFLVNLSTSMPSHFWLHRLKAEITGSVQQKSFGL